MIQRLHAAHRAGIIEDRLRQMTHTQVHVLRVHYGGGSLPYVDVAATLASSARALILARVREEAKTAIQLLRAARQRGDERGERLSLQALRVARAAAHRWRSQPIPSEILRIALMEATKPARERIRIETEAMVRDAVQAYESTQVERRRPVQVHDARPGRWN